MGFDVPLIEQLSHDFVYPVGWRRVSMPFVEQVTQSGFLFGSCPAHDIHGSEDSCRSKTPKKQEHGHPDHHRQPGTGPFCAAT